MARRNEPVFDSTDDVPDWLFQSAGEVMAEIEAEEEAARLDREIPWRPAGEVMAEIEREEAIARGEIPDDMLRPAGEVLADAADWTKHEFHSVSSSTIESVAYDNLVQMMWIHFKGYGSIYEYCDVPEWKFHGLLAASSPGSYHATHIRCVHEYREITSNHTRDDSCFAKTKPCAE